MTENIRQTTARAAKSRNRTIPRRVKCLDVFDQPPKPEQELANVSRNRQDDRANAG